MKAITSDDGKRLKIVDDNDDDDDDDASIIVERHLIWLRDHCKCDGCYNSVTSQKKVNVIDIPIEIRAKDCQIDGDSLKIVWDDDHKSSYSIAFLKETSFENYIQKLKRKYILWSKNTIASSPVCHVDYQVLLSKKEGVLTLMKSLLVYGVGFVENVPANIEATESAILKISHVQHTLFGGMWEFSDSMSHNDTAYTNEELGAHTDNTYFTEAAGLQVLHCLSHEGTGGETLLVDGFKALDLMKQKHPNAFERLTKTCVEAEYLEPGQHHVYTSPLIRLHPITGQYEQIRYNVHDRAPVCLPENQILQHYQDLQALGSTINNRDLEWRFKLKPGTVLIFDNFRVLHGRSSYTGRRTMCGCYIGRGDFLSKARVLNLI